MRIQSNKRGFTMNLVIIFWLILAIVVLIVTFILIKGILKAIMISIFIILLLTAAFTFFVVKDALDLKENFMGKEKLMVLKENETVLAAFSFKSISEKDNLSINALKNEKFKVIERAIKSDNFSGLNENYYKVFVFDYSAFNNSLANGISFPIEKKELSLDRDEIKSILDSNEPLSRIFPKLADANNINLQMLSDLQRADAINTLMKKIGISSEEQFKSSVFALMIADLVKERGTPEIISKLKNKEIFVYPNTIIFKALRLIPQSLLTKMSKKAEDSPAATS
jgi:hypothetical protein